MINRDEFLKELKEEKRLRKAVRSLLENYLAEKQEKVVLEENRLRGIIRSLIKEVSADVPDEQPQRSTGINVLEDTLKVIIPSENNLYRKEIKCQINNKVWSLYHILSPNHWLKGLLT